MAAKKNTMSNYKGTERNWVFTKQATPEETAAWTELLNGAAIFQDPFKWHNDSRVKYTVYQIERAPTTGQLHVQGLLCFKNSVRLTGAKELIGDNPHLEKCMSVKDAIKYCKKAETKVAGPWEHGKAPVHQGERSDLSQAWEDIKARKSMYDMLEENPDIAKYERALKLMESNVMARRSNRQLQKVKVYVFYGSTGLGKTYSAINIFCNNVDDQYYILNTPSDKRGKLWFDGYKGQETLIIDDFSASVCSMEYLKRLLDVYPMQVEVKGSQTHACWTTVIITSNIAPRDWYAPSANCLDIIDLGPLRRRIYQIRRFVDLGMYIEEDWDGNALSDAKPVEMTDMRPPIPVDIPQPVPVIPSPLPVPDDEPQLLVGDLTGDQLPSMPDNSDYSSFDDTLDNVFIMDGLNENNNE